MASYRGFSVCQTSRLRVGICCHAPTSPLPPCCVRPCGTAFSMAVRIPLRSSGRSRAFRSVCTAIMPQPMSTPTAAGIIAPLGGITLPTGAPLHSGHGCDPLENEGKLRHVEELGARLVFERHALRPSLDGHALFSAQHVVFGFLGHGILGRPNVRRCSKTDN